MTPHHLPHQPTDPHARAAAHASLRRSGLAGALASLAVLVAACAPIVTRHGHHFQDSDVSAISTGMSQDQVRSQLGSPTTTATVGGGSAYYYIASTQSETAFFKAKETDRKVLAVYFTPMGSVERVANYGLQDGKVIDYVKRETPNSARDENILRQLFRNLGTKQLGLE
jgi:outer membrane protein assembly factor BamE (lipoprotein component of BamABCDE complex)